MSGFRGTPGESYRPSNGTEGDMFQAAFCDRCTKDLHAPHDGGCGILVAVLVFHPGEEGYPPEWTYDADGLPTCTAFDPIDGEDEDEDPAPTPTPTFAASQEAP